MSVKNSAALSCQGGGVCEKTSFTRPRGADLLPSFLGLDVTPGAEDPLTLPLHGFIWLIAWHVHGTDGDAPHPRALGVAALARVHAKFRRPCIAMVSSL